MDSSYSFLDRLWFDGQQFIKDAAAKRGFKQVYEWNEGVFDFKNELNYELPEGYHFVEPKDMDIVKCSKLCWYGFGHGDKGEFKDWNKYDDSYFWTPAKSHKDCWSSYLSPTPHETPEYYILIADKNEEYVCFSGMWWVPQNRLRKRLPLHNLEEMLGLQKIFKPRLHRFKIVFGDEVAAQIYVAVDKGDTFGFEF